MNFAALLVTVYGLADSKRFEPRVTFKELFPWIDWLAAQFEAVSGPFYYFFVALTFVFLVLAGMLVAGYEIQVFPRPKIVKFRYKWTTRGVATFALLTALTTIASAFGGLIYVIPGVMAVNIFYYAFMFVFPVVFGWPGIWSAPAGEILGVAIRGVLRPVHLVCGFAYDFYLGWWAWKTLGRDTSLRTAKSWILLIGVYVLYAFLQSFSWSPWFIIFGVIPMAMYMARSAFNIVWYYFFIWLYPPLLAATHALATRYRLHWKLIEPQPYSRVQ